MSVGPASLDTDHESSREPRENDQDEQHSFNDVNPLNTEPVLAARAIDQTTNACYINPPELHLVEEPHLVPVRASSAMPLSRRSTCELSPSILAIPRTTFPLAISCCWP